MGIPAFFRWLQQKYPDIVDHVDPKSNLDAATKQPMWCDNLYLDMNGIIHPCTHPEDKPAPKTEDEMFEAIYQYTDMLMEMTKPRNLVYLAIDGVAPRAKMNQQRSRRFRAAQESEIKAKEIEEIRKKLRADNIEPTESHATPFDSNVITPGTTFMSRLSGALQKWIEKKLSTFDERGVWHKNLKVILSDASVPGEGEHKIMSYLREQKTLPNYNPHLRHCLCGADADLIMLGLTTHEQHFVILREEFKPNQQRPCEVCLQYGHNMKECQGILSIEEGKKREITSGNRTDFIYICLAKLRQHLLAELKRDSSVELDFERFIDDFIFLCFFVGNDFLPHLPCLEIRENAVDRLLKIYHQVNGNYWREGLYLNEHGNVNLERCQEILKELGSAEEDIFLRRNIKESRYQNNLRNNKKKKWQQDNNNYNDNDYPEPPPPPEDTVRLGEAGWKERYYNSKFNFTGPYRVIVDTVTREYVRGLCWVLKYYFSGCPDWQWFYPFHYAPFAQDMRSIMTVELNFNSEAPPFRPLEQLMSVFPERSADALPESWRKLMSDPESPIIDFYPTNFKIDLNGKTATWMGVALLPFIDENRLFEALKSVYPNLNEEETIRNARGEEMHFTSKTST